MNAERLIDDYLRSLHDTLRNHTAYATWFREDLGLEWSDHDDSDAVRTDLIGQALTRIVATDILYPDPMDPEASPDVRLTKLRVLSERFGLEIPEVTEEDLNDPGKLLLEDSWIHDLVNVMATTWPERLFSPRDLVAAGEIVRAYGRSEGEFR